MSEVRDHFAFLILVVSTIIGDPPVYDEKRQREYGDFRPIFNFLKILKILRRKIFLLISACYNTLCYCVLMHITRAQFLTGKLDFILLICHLSICTSIQPIRF